MTLTERTPSRLKTVIARFKKPNGYSSLYAQDRSQPHWAFDYASRLARRHPESHRILIQTSMSPSGPFHIGNLRDTVCAYLVHRALQRMGRRSAILLGFDDYDPFRARQAAVDPELAPYSGRPLATARERSRRICRDYIAELKALGICPIEADIDGRTPPESDWQTHYQWERYTSGEYSRLQRRYVRGSRRLGGLLGVDDPRRLFAVYCEQCGSNETTILRLHPDRVRYHCRNCTAMLTTTRPGPVKPSWALDWTLRVTHEHIDCEPAGQDHCSAGSTMDRTRPLYHRFLRSHQPVIVPYGLVREPGQRNKISGSGEGGLLPRHLLAVMPAEMILWLYSRNNCLSDIRVSLRRSHYLAAYAEYDRFRSAVGHDEHLLTLYRLISDRPPREAPLPGMRRVIGLLHSHCYDIDRVIAVLQDGSSDPEALSERVRHAMAWISTHGRDTSWLAGPAADSLPLFAGENFSGPWDRRRHRSLHVSLFNVSSGPPLRVLLELFGEDAMVKAIRIHRETGERPLRELLLTRLDGQDSGEG